MPSGHVKVYHPDRKFGFITAEDGKELFLSADDLGATTVKAGDRIDYEVAEGDSGAKAVNVEVVHAASDDTPVGHTMAAPPSWHSLEDRERARRQNRRRRR